MGEASAYAHVFSRILGTINLWHMWLFDLLLLWAFHTWNKSLKESLDELKSLEAEIKLMGRYAPEGLKPENKPTQHANVRLKKQQSRVNLAVNILGFGGLLLFFLAAIFSRNLFR